MIDKTEQLIINESPLDLNLGRFFLRLAGKDRREIFAAGVLLSRAMREGNICLDLTKVQVKELISQNGAFLPLVLPALEDWRRILTESGLAGKREDYFPLVIDDKNRLYLLRYFRYEERLINFIAERLSDSFNGAWRPGGREADDGFGNLLDLLFPREESPSPVFQKLAALKACLHPLTIVTGSPGTGKTTSVVKTLALLIGLAGDSPLRIALAAPTGKAAARLKEVVARSKDVLPCPDWIKSRFPERSYTVHRLLGPLPNSPYFRHNEVHPLPYDVVVVDEASMLDLALAAKLIAALSDRAKLILVGDKNQLASVEGGNVFGDLCGEGGGTLSAETLSRIQEHLTEEDLNRITVAPGFGINDLIVELKDNFRFPGDSLLGRLSRAVASGDSEAALNILKTKGQNELVWRDYPGIIFRDGEFKDTVINHFKDYLLAIKNKEDFNTVYLCFDRFRILSPLNQGPRGSVHLSSLAEDILKEADLLKPGSFPPGKPLIVTRNNYELGLFNGDIGIVMSDAPSGRPMAFFPGESQEAKKIPLSLLPEHESAFALTCHRAQGSEFDHLLIILPDFDFPLLTRELIYTAITRAKKTVCLWGDIELFKLAVSRRIERSSGLRDAFLAGGSQSLS